MCWSADKLQLLTTFSLSRPHPHRQHQAAAIFYLFTLLVPAAMLVSKLTTMLLNTHHANATALLVLKLTTMLMLNKHHTDASLTNKHYTAAFLIAFLLLSNISLNTSDLQTHLKLLLVLNNVTHWTRILVNSKFGREIEGYFMTELAVSSNTSPMWLISIFLTAACLRNTSLYTLLRVS